MYLVINYNIVCETAACSFKTFVLPNGQAEIKVKLNLSLLTTKPFGEAEEYLH
jgi:hypothetical protein